jgi:hypothetical protein
MPCVFHLPRVSIGASGASSTAVSGGIRAWSLGNTGWCVHVQSRNNQRPSSVVWLPMGLLPPHAEAYPHHSLLQMGAGVESRAVEVVCEHPHPEVRGAYCPLPDAHLRKCAERLFSCGLGVGHGYPLHAR